jgi:hypothetical protein
MPGNNLLTREEHLQKLEGFCTALHEVFTRGGLSPDQSQEVWRVGVAGECTRCGIHVYGEELYALSQPPSEKYANAKLGRLRLGNCARDGCNAYSYRLAFYPYGELDWPEILANVGSHKEEAGAKPAEEFKLAHSWSFVSQSSLVRQAALGLLLVGVLLMVRQWYIGGRIPLLREPHKFQVAPESVRVGNH